MTPKSTLKVGVIIGSQRVVRVGPQVAKFVLDTLQVENEEACRHIPPTQKQATFDLVDLKAQNLPFFDEPCIPQQIKSAEGYTNEHTRAWSRRISDLDAFIFVSAQRNWGIPAELKNAIDYLFHEWKGKPAMIVTYGGHGGNQCAEQLKTVIQSIGMHVTDNMVGMAFPTPDFRVKCFQGKELNLDTSDDTGSWARYRSEIVSSWNQLVGEELGV